MGAHLVTEALSAAYAEAIDGRPLVHSSWRVFITMAHSARDLDGKNPARLYLGGWQSLAYSALNYTEWKKGGTANRTIARAISDLISRGLIRPVTDYENGRKSVYEVLPRVGHG